MSLNRENVIWKSGNYWYIGFFDYTVIGEDYEWDVDYNFSEFHWASGPHKTKEESREAWTGANPGGHTLIESGDVQKYDQIFKDWLAAKQEEISYFKAF